MFGFPVFSMAPTDAVSSPALPIAPRWRSLLAIGLLAFAVRLTLIFVVGDPGRPDTAFENGEIARELAAGNGFRFAFFGRPEPSSHQAPLLPWTLAAAYHLFGIGSPAALHAWSVLAAVAGAIACVLAVRLGARLSRPAAGLWAGAGAALYPPLAYAATRVQTINLTIPFLLGLVWLGVSCRERPTAGRALAFGALGGLALLCDPITAAAIAVLTVWMGLSIARSSPGGARSALLACGLTFLGCCLVLAPWTARNWSVHGRLILVKSSFGYVLWQGNNPNATGTDKLLPRDAPADAEAAALRDPTREEAELDRRRLDVRSVDETMPEELRATLRAQPDEIHRMDVLGERAWEWIRTHPTDYAQLCLRRLGYLLWFDPTNPRSSSLYYRLSYFLLLVLALPGIVLSVRRGGPWAPLYLAALAQSAVHVLVITSARFRLPLEACLLLPAAHFAATVCSRLQRRA